MNILEKTGLLLKQEFRDGETVYIVKQTGWGESIESYSVEIANFEGFDRLTGRCKIYVRRGLFELDENYEHDAKNKLTKNLLFFFNSIQTFFPNFLSHS